jgi:hypothetical protein
MNLFEVFADIGLSDAIIQVVADLFGKKISEEQAQKIIDTLSVSDIIAVSDAYDANDTSAIRSIFFPEKTEVNELSFQGRDKPISAAADRPLPHTRPAPVSEPEAAPEPATATPITSPAVVGRNDPDEIIAPADDEVDPDQALNELRRLCGMRK